MNNPELCPYCLQRNPAPCHIQAHEKRPSDLQDSNHSLIRKALEREALKTVVRKTHHNI